MQEIIRWFMANPFGFFNSAEHGVPPAEAVVITEAERDALLQGQAQGRVIGTDPQGRPVLQEVAAQVPERVTMRQARLALLKEGRLQAVEEAIAAIPSPQREAAQIEWAYASNIERNSPFVQQMADALALDETAMDALFIAAAAL